MAVFETFVQLKCSAEDAFNFLIRPAEAVKTSPPDVNLTFQDAPEVIELGSRLHFTLQAYGQTQKAEHAISAFDAPHHFTETQIKGPMKSWVHEHIVQPLGDELCLVTDRITFDPPGGLVGLIMTESKVRKMLESGYAHRHETMQQLLDQNS